MESITPLRGPANSKTTTDRGLPRSILVVVGIAALFALSAVLVGYAAALPGPSAPAATSPTTALLNSPKLTLSATSGGSAISITVTGHSFPAHKTVSVTFVDPLVPKFNLDGQPAPYNKPVTAHVNKHGAFTATFNTPQINDGSYEFLATAGSVQATAAFSITSGSTTLKIHPTSIAPGGCVKMTGSNFYPGDVENLYIGPWSGHTGYKTLHSFDDNFATGAIDHHLCFGSATFPAGTYALLVVGDTYGSGTVTLTIT
jgi:hypothetical protein